MSGSKTSVEQKFVYKRNTWLLRALIVGALCSTNAHADAKSVKTGIVYSDCELEAIGSGYRVINSAQDFLDATNGALPNQNLVLGRDLDFSNLTLTGRRGSKFSGVIEGCTHTLRNLYFVSDPSDATLAATLLEENSGTIRNLNISAVFVELTNGYAPGVVADKNSGTLQNISVSDYSVVSLRGLQGGAVVNINTGTISSVRVSDIYMVAGPADSAPRLSGCVGGVAAQSQGVFGQPAKIEDATVKNIEISEVPNADDFLHFYSALAHTGGIVGLAQQTNISRVSVSNFNVWKESVWGTPSTFSLPGYGAVGGIVGSAKPSNGSASAVQITSASVTGLRIIGGVQRAGVIGISNGSIISSATVSGEILPWQDGRNRTSFAGGFIGTSSNDTVILSKFTGTVAGTSVGLFAGTASGSLAVDQVAVAGTVAGDGVSDGLNQGIGGFIGKAFLGKSQTRAYPIQDIRIDANIDPVLSTLGKTAPATAIVGGLTGLLVDTSYPMLFRNALVLTTNAIVPAFGRINNLPIGAVTLGTGPLSILRLLKTAVHVSILSLPSWFQNAIFLRPQPTWMHSGHAHCGR